MENSRSPVFWLSREPGNRTVGFICDFDLLIGDYNKGKIEERFRLGPKNIESMCFFLREICEGREDEKTGEPPPPLEVILDKGDPCLHVLGEWDKASYFYSISFATITRDRSERDLKLEIPVDKIAGFFRLLEKLLWRLIPTKNLKETVWLEKFISSSKEIVAKERESILTLDFESLPGNFEGAKDVVYAHYEDIVKIGKILRKIRKKREILENPDLPPKSPAPPAPPLLPPTPRAKKHKKEKKRRWSSQQQVAQAVGEGGSAAQANNSKSGPSSVLSSAAAEREQQVPGEEQQEILLSIDPGQLGFVSEPPNPKRAEAAQKPVQTYKDPLLSSSSIYFSVPDTSHWTNESRRRGEDEAAEPLSGGLGCAPDLDGLSAGSILGYQPRSQLGNEASGDLSTPPTEPDH